MKHKFTHKNKPSPIKAAKATAAESALRNLPIPALVGTINTMLGILKERGFPAMDWDDKSRSVYKLIFHGGKAYILLTHDKQEEPPTKEESANDTNHDPRG